jgi:hypothetical protein
MLLCLSQVSVYAIQATDRNACRKETWATLLFFFPHSEAIDFLPSGVQVGGSDLEYRCSEDSPFSAFDLLQL